ncbi:hypothetical protein [Microbacterium terrisoli]|uniref:hypothetical protein n=1 Tax=Microbacterium terrisoli TaxID=3242192 RepID=UPI002804B78E|nr:hypothetical protein [Microbacterium protaetiae]
MREIMGWAQRAAGTACERLRSAWGVVGNESTDDRGDVPGWVLITLMTAGLVVVIWALAGPALADLFTQAIDKVSGL